MSEVRLWRKIRKVWKGHGVRIEASHGEAEAGTPDCNMSIKGKGGWVELKIWPEPLRVSQRVWHADALSRGALAVVVAEFPKRGYWIGYWYEYERLTAESAAGRLGELDMVLGIYEGLLNG